MGSQTKISQTILDRGADYLLALKDNRMIPAEEVALFFDSSRLILAACSLPVRETPNSDHGRTPIITASRPAATASATMWAG